MLFFVRVCISVFVLVGVIRCTTTPKPANLSASDAPLLTQAEAKFRKKQISNVKYQLEFDLTSDQFFSGSTTIQFDLKKKGDGLRVDFHGGTVQSVFYNEVKVNVTYNNHYLWLPSEILKTGHNKLKVLYTRKYSKNGAGLHQFVDPVDNRRYLYTNMEPFDANKVFPCFDQPNLKATYSLKVKAPTGWAVITSNREEEIKNINSNTQLWSFPESAIFSTYIWPLHAGPYTSWSSKAGDIPLRLFARQSLAKQVKPKDWFEFTQQGFEFFNSYFDYKYPYKKYDQLIVPEFNWGAMENVAAVTFSERLVVRGEKSQKQLMSLSNIINHEMAHMWFGNLVTMNWWNDLWLNESFATYTASLAQSHIGKFQNNVWTAFNGSKEWAYSEDEMVTTHPIEALVPDTQQAMANFDGITYGKGAASLKQLAYYIGEENFRNGVRDYFKKHANGNTELADFIKALGAHSKHDLQQWQKKWLQTAGVNSVEPHFTCTDGKVNFFSLKQSAPTSTPTIRPHALEIAFIERAGEDFKVNNIVKTSIDDTETLVSEAIGLACPDIVYPNYNDHAYIKTKLDSVSLGHLKQSISQIDDSFLRLLFWNTLWDMTQFAQLSFEAYGEMVLTGSLRNEADPFVVDHLQETLLMGHYGYTVLNYSIYKDGHNSSSYRNWLTRSENLIWLRLRTAAPGSELQKKFFNGFVNVAETPLGQKRIRDLLNGRTLFKKFKIDQDKRWELIQNLARNGNRSSKRYIQQESKKDTSWFGKRSRIVAEAVQPIWSEKQKIISAFVDPKSDMSFDAIRSASRQMFPASQGSLRQKFSNDFFGLLSQLNKGNTPDKAEVFAGLAPNECIEAPGRIQSFITQHPELKPQVLTQLKKIRQNHERCRAAIELAKTKKFSQM